MMLGGVVRRGGPTPRAFLWRRDAGGTWSALTLPDRDLIGGINDILPAAGGAWYVVCGGEGGSGLATILRVDGGGVSARPDPVLRQPAATGGRAAGHLHAVGYRLTSGAGMRLPLLLKNPERHGAGLDPVEPVALEPMARVMLQCACHRSFGRGKWPGSTGEGTMRNKQLLLALVVVLLLPALSGAATLDSSPPLRIATRGAPKRRSSSGPAPRWCCLSSACSWPTPAASRSNASTTSNG